MWKKIVEVFRFSKMLRAHTDVNKLRDIYTRCLPVVHFGHFYVTSVTRATSVTRGPRTVIPNPPITNV